MTKAISPKAIMLSPDQDMTDDEEWIDGCYTTSTKESGKVASICDILSIKDLISRDFSDTTQCNYYTTYDKFAYLPIAMAFQVWLFGFSFLFSRQILVV